MSIAEAFSRQPSAFSFVRPAAVEGPFMASTSSPRTAHCLTGTLFDLTAHCQLVRLPKASLEEKHIMTLSEFLQVFFTAAAPISELRAAIPLAVNVHHISWPIAFVVAIAGNLLPVPFLLLFLDPLSKLLSKVKLFERIINWVFERSRRRGKIIERYETIGLALFVAVPFPITGAWTGAIIAFLLGISFWRAFISIAIGVLIAGAIVTTLTIIGWWGAVIAGVGLGIIAILGMRKS